MTDKKKRKSIVVATPPCRFNYVHLAEPDTQGRYADNKYSVMVMIPKEHIKTEVYDTMIEGICAAANVEAIEDVKKHPLIDMEGNLKDGDEGVYADREGFPGHIFFKTKSTQQPVVFSYESGTKIKVDPENIADTINSGDYGVAMLAPWEYRDGEVTFILKEVWLTKKGKPLGGPNTDALFAASFASGDSGEKKKKENGSLAGMLD
jgi:hypothetical protein